MPPFLASLLSGAGRYVLIGGVALLLVGGAYLEYRHLTGEVALLQADNQTLKDNLAQAQAVNASNVQELAKVRADAQAAIDALTADKQAAEARAAKTSALHSQVSHAPATDDAPAAPVLDDALDGLR